MGTQTYRRKTTNEMGKRFKEAHRKIMDINRYREKWGEIREVNVRKCIFEAD